MLQLMNGINELIKNNKHQWKPKVFLLLICGTNKVFLVRHTAWQSLIIKQIMGLLGKLMPTLLTPNVQKLNTKCWVNLAAAISGNS